MSINPEAIEAAQHAMMWKKLPFGGNDLTISLDANAAHAAAKLALSAALPLIEARAKAEGLREAAEYAVANIAIWDGNATLTDVSTEVAYDDTASWLRARADQLEGKAK